MQPYNHSIPSYNHSTTTDIHQTSFQAPAPATTAAERSARGRCASHDAAQEPERAQRVLQETARERQVICLAECCGFDGFFEGVLEGFCVFSVLDTNRE